MPEGAKTGDIDRYQDDNETGSDQRAVLRLEREWAGRAIRAALSGVRLNVGLGWWWADPVAALVIALAVREGLEIWEDEDDD